MVIGITALISDPDRLTFSLTIGALNDAAQNGLAADMISDFRTVLLTVITFYFGSETVITATKLITTARMTDPQARADMGKLDRDLPILVSQAADKAAAGKGAADQTAAEDTDHATTNR